MLLAGTVFGIVRLNSEVELLQSLHVYNFNSLQQHFKSILSQSLSPDKSRQLTSYNLSFNKLFFDDYDLDYYPNQFMIAIKDMDTGISHYIFMGDRAGEPKWLGNDYIFYTDYCGTGCQAFILRDVSSGELHFGYLGYFFRDNGTAYTLVQDWSGKLSRLEGLSQDIVSETANGKTFLVFGITDGQGKQLGEKKLLFHEDSLALTQN